MRSWRVLILIASCVWALWAGEVQAATVNAASCSRTDVAAAITTAVANDTVAVPAGSCTWTSLLTITKGITLQGAGIGVTVITHGPGFNTMLIYDPGVPTTNNMFRITGFTFDGGSVNTNGAPLIRVHGGNQVATIQTKLRIDHNRFKNIGLNSISLWHAGIRGVIDHNEFGPNYYTMRTPTSSIGISGLTSGRSEWTYWEGVKFGEVDNSMYIEDNVMETMDQGDHTVIVSDCQEGGRYVFRYNTINLATLANGQPLFDMHGNNSGNQLGCMGGELYGNNVVGGVGGQFMDQRGGRAFIFNNNAAPLSGEWKIRMREEFADSTTPITYVGPNPPQYDQHVNGTYFWGNRVNLTGTLFALQNIEFVGDIPLAGRDFFHDGSTPGISQGTLGSRPATCAIGEGYWATTQSTTSLAGMVGPNPATPISGTLYRCTATDFWDAGASPLPYPHYLTVTEGPPEEFPGIDTFNRADGDPGANWTAITGMNKAQIVDNHIEPLGLDEPVTRMVYTGITWPDNQYCSATVLAAVDTGSVGGVVLRSLTTENTGYQIAVAGPLGAGAVLSIRKITAGVPVTLYSAVTTVNSGDVLKGKIFGGTISVFINDVEQTTYTDTPFLQSGSCGVALFSVSGSTADFQLDSFGGGEFTDTTPTAPANPHFSGGATGTAGTLLWESTATATGGYRVYCGTATGAYVTPARATRTAAVALASHSPITQATIKSNVATTLFCIVKAFDSQNTEGPASAESSLVFTGLAARTARTNPTTRVGTP